MQAKVVTKQLRAYHFPGCAESVICSRGYGRDDLVKQSRIGWIRDSDQVSNLPCTKLIDQISLIQTPHRVTGKQAQDKGLRFYERHKTMSKSKIGIDDHLKAAVGHFERHKSSIGCPTEQRRRGKNYDPFGRTRCHVPAYAFNLRKQRGCPGAEFIHCRTDLVWLSK